MITLTALLAALTASAQSFTLPPASPPAIDTSSVSAPSVLVASATDSAQSMGVRSADAVAPSVVLMRDPLRAPDDLGARSESDTVRRRPRAVQMSDAAILRLRIHRYASYTVIPLFILQSVAGNQLVQADNGGEPRPGWAKSSHSFGAAALGTVFTVNTITGLWSLWDSRGNDQGRALRWVHSALMLASDAGFTYTGITLSNDAKHSQSGRDDHRNWAYASMGVALTGYGIMYFGNR
jgi:hypothetical protein